MAKRYRVVYEKWNRETGWESGDKEVSEKDLPRLKRKCGTTFRILSISEEKDLSMPLPEDENPPGVEAVCENCGKPCEYDGTVCLCKKCETATRPTRRRK